MDLETENKIVKALNEEARRMRMKAEKEGADMYLRQPGARAQQNSRFLSATVLGVQQEYYSDWDRHGLQDDEIKQFPRSRVKLGRCEIGLRMDETGPYFRSTYHTYSSNVQYEDKQERMVLGPEKQLSLKSSSEKNRKENSFSRDKKKEKHKQKKKRKEERSKHCHRSRRSE